MTPDASTVSRSKLNLLFPNGLLGLRGVLTTFLLVVASLRAEDAGQSIAPQNSVFEDFKRFISSPPPIESLVYRVKLLAHPSRPDLGVAGSHNFQVYIAAWQTNAWTARAIHPEDNLDHKIIRGWAMFAFEDEYWHLEPGAAILWIDDDPVVEGVKIEVPTKRPNRTKTVAHFLKARLSETMNMGVSNLEPGSIEWDGNRFQAYYREREQRIEGELFQGANGYPSHVRVSYSSPTNSTHVRIEYSYGDNVGLPFVPARIRTVKLENGKEKEYGEIAVLSIKPVSEPLPKALFDALPFIATNRASVRYFTNGALHEFNRQGELVLAKEVLRKGPRQPSAPGFYAVGTLTTAAFLVLAFRAKSSETKTKTKK